MPGRLKTSLDWWKQACEDSPYAIAFVRSDDIFLWVNESWSRLTGYTSSDLVNLKRWQDITVPEDVGSDQMLTEQVKRNEKIRYYCEKTYVRSDGTKVNVAIMVHRHPIAGELQGYVVFAQAMTSAEYLQLQSEFNAIEREINILTEANKNWADLSQRMTQLEVTTKQQFTDIKSMLQMVVSSAKNTGGVNFGGGFIGGDNTGRDKNSTVLFVVLALVVAAIAVVVFGGYLLFNANGLQVGGQP